MTVETLSAQSLADDVALMDVDQVQALQEQFHTVINTLRRISTRLSAPSAMLAKVNQAFNDTYSAVSGLVNAPSVLANQMMETVHLIASVVQLLDPSEIERPTPHAPHNV